MIKFDQKPINESNPIIYIHIPKSGGQTMWNLFRQQQELIHVWHNRFFCKLNEPATYITNIRHPVDRVISTYYHIRRYERDPLHKPVNQMTLEEFVSWVQDESIENKRYKSKRKLENIRYRTVNLATRYISGGDPEDIKLAKRNLRKSFDYVGVMDYYMESLYVMQKMYGWDLSSFRKKNDNPGRPKVQEISQDLIHVIEMYNEHDIALHQYAKERFEKKLNLLNETERYELKDWVQQNK
ncbi:sulfotransferase family 2 domain-containing protein [Alkalibacillus haloalkaliphilus]|uniref:sulfotransferase family 2 domain-containing protein n=1 Tax=Alkalibacillus haloalkaliphilus TaxID=94136 RepID=UPI002936B5FC|nr:sulfotransferase family 2 domain-containing protein [Alkalibacillus haloalkaliphilus]MDV2582914.1 sulfotransferase family 2 domain-containing protein [Alkalibacillus haloalkaliphilus]